ncbi:MAG: glycosyltransferase family 2 protein, partial [Desulfovibrio sp.]|nr:glycosyltransferase family 2 protein [Desulfovibrio sp.]
MSKSRRPKFSVIMNCLDCERYLPAALASLKAQSCQDFEIIFWDNGSRDESAAIALDYGPRLRYFRSEETVPLGQARNLAISKAEGEYVAFLDCDDLWRPGKLEKQLALLEA